MAEFHVELKEPARRQIQKLSPLVARRIVAALEKLASNPYPRGTAIARLKGHDNVYRLRIGDWRAVFEIVGRTVSVLYVGKRSEIYSRGGF